jgi:hypothetical protein
MGGLGGVGGAILGHVLGGKRAPVEAGIGRATGMNGSQVSQLLVLLAPIVMAALGRMARQRNADPGALGGMLQEEQHEVARRAPGAGGLGGLLDSDNDGQIMDDLARMAPGMLGGLFGREEDGTRDGTRDTAEGRAGPGMGAGREIVPGHASRFSPRRVTPLSRSRLLRLPQVVVHELRLAGHLAHHVRREPVGELGDRVLAGQLDLGEHERAIGELVDLPREVACVTA